MSINITYSHASIQTKSEVQNFLNEWNNDSQTIKVNTSGSTSIPKTIELKKSNMKISAEKTLSFLKIHADETAFLCLSPNTIASKMMILRSIIGKLNLIVGSIDSNPLQDQNIRIDFIALVPYQLQKILEKHPEKLKSIKSIIIGGGPISNELKKLIISHGITVNHTYGMTETISHVAMRKVGLQEQQEFHALPGISFDSKDDKLIINYPEIGIINLETNDIVELKSPTTFKWKGRADFIINSGGIKVNPEELETILASMIQIPFFIGSLEDSALGQKIVLIIESKKKKNIIKEDLLNLLPKYSLPKEIFYLPIFIRTESGKINRRETMQLIDSYAIKEVL